MSSAPLDPIPTISNKQILASARKGLNERTLSVFHPYPGRHAKDGCVYNGYNGSHCVIGQALADAGIEVPSRLNFGTSVIGLQSNNVVRFEDRTFAQNMQALHDAAVVKQAIGRIGLIPQGKTDAIFAAYDTRFVMTVAIFDEIVTAMEKADAGTQHP